MASVMEQTVHAGHTISIKYKGATIGRIQGFDGERSYGTQGVYEIGSIMPQEHIPLRYEGSLSVERFFVRKSDLHGLGIGSMGREILKKGVIDIVVESKYAMDSSAVTQSKTAVDTALEKMQRAKLTRDDASMLEAQDEYNEALGNMQTLIAEGAEVRTYHGCTLVSCRESFRANAIAGENAVFTYLYCTTQGVDASEASNIG